MTSARLFTNYAPGGNSSQTELWYYRVVFFMVAAMYVVPALLYPIAGVKEFLAPRPLIAVLPLAFVLCTFIIPFVKKHVNEFAILIFLLVTVHVILFLFTNNFNTHFEIGILTLILFSNLHIVNLIYLVLYNVIVLGVIEFILIAGNLNASVNPVLLFLSVVVVMIFAVAYQLYRIRQQRVQRTQQDVLQTAFESAPAALMLFDKKTFALAGANKHANELLLLQNDENLRTLFALEELSDDDILKMAAAGTFINKKVLTRNQQEVFVSLTMPAGNEQLISCLCMESGIETIAPATKEESVAESKESLQHDELFPSILSANGWGMLSCKSDGVILKANAEVCHSVGYAEEELKMLTLPQLIHPSDMNVWRQAVTDSVTQEAAKAEIRLIHKKGKPVYLNSTFKKFANGNGEGELLLFTEDVTEWRTVQKELSDAKANVSTVIENTNDIIFSVDMNHHVTVMNTSFRNFFEEQYDREIKRNDIYRDFLPESERKGWNDMHTRVMRGEKIQYREEFSDEKGEKHFYEISLNPITNENNLITGVSFFGREVTDRMQYEKEIIKAKDVAEAATAAKSRFLATMTHEIRTPLNGIVGILELLRTTPLKDKQREYVNTLRLSSENMLTIINDVLDFSKIESEKMELENKPFELRKVIEETFDLLYYRSLEKKLELFYNIDESIPAFIMGDSLRLKQVLVNLAGNAIKFTDKGHVLITVQLQPSTDETLEVKFTIKDTGPGITEEQKGRLFKSFSQADESTFRKYGGTGLGLTISSNLVSLMHGNIWVESVPGQGSSFIFTIKTKPAPIASPKNARVNTKLLQGKKFLILSAGEEFKNEISVLFDQWNISQKWVSSDIAAKKELTGKTNFDAMLIDAQLPDYLMYAEDLKENIREQNLPVFVINAALENDEIVFSNKLFEAVLPTGINKLKLATVLVRSFYKNISTYYSSGDDQEFEMDGSLAEKYPLEILIAEDNPINQTLAQTVLEKLGYQIDMVGDGVKVLEKIKTKKYDLIFMDVQMPHKDGLETTMEIRKLPAMQSTPVIIAMTAFAMDGDKEKCIEAGMNDYISKPIRIENIQGVIEKWSGKKQEHRKENLVTTANTIEPVIDQSMIERLKQLAPKDDNAFLKSLAEMFKKQMVELVDEIENYYVANDFDGVYKTAHKLKGSAANIGAKRLAGCCQKIEVSSRENKTTEVKFNIDNLKIIKDLTMREMDKFNA